MVGEEPIEITKKYTCLGVEISDSGSFKGAQQALFKNALRALFKLKGMVGGANLLPQVTLMLFDQLIKPIALYGSEIWGHETISTKTPRNFWIVCQTRCAKSLTSRYAGSRWGSTGKLVLQEGSSVDSHLE